ncbi:unnamed protein product [Rhodiola kirilowii]
MIAWRGCDPNWEANRRRLADCAIWFGKGAVGRQKVVAFTWFSDPSDDDVVNPKPGTLRYGVDSRRALWIIFKRDMVISKRGARDELAQNDRWQGSQRPHCEWTLHQNPLRDQHHHTRKSTFKIASRGAAMWSSGISPHHAGHWRVSDADGVSIFGGKNIWIDHCSLSNCEDGMIDAIHGIYGHHDFE